MRKRDSYIRKQWVQVSDGEFEPYILEFGRFRAQYMGSDNDPVYMTEYDFTVHHSELNGGYWQSPIYNCDKFKFIGKVVDNLRDLSRKHDSIYLSQFDINCISDFIRLNM